MTRYDSTSEPCVIAEIGGNHAGDIALAEKMIRIAAHFCEVDAIKFQKRDSRTLLSAAQYDAPHPNPMHSYAATYGQHREFLEFDFEQHRHLMGVCEASGLIYSTSVWDLPSAEGAVALEPEFIKVPSAVNTNTALLEYLCAEYHGDIHVSLGMTDRAEEDTLVGLLSDHDRLSSTVLYACTSGYPVAFEDLCLREISRLVAAYGDDVKGVGFSGHHLGIAADVAAQTLGARWIERHFTLDRSMKGTDHAASLEPDGMRRLARDTRAVAKALTYKSDAVLPVEQLQREKLKWRGTES